MATASFQNNLNCIPKQIIKFRQILDLVFCVFGCDTIPSYKAEILKIEETWALKAKEYPSVKVLYFLGEERTDLVGDPFIHLPGVLNDYMSASYKQYQGLDYIHQNYPCKFVFFCGTDTFVNIPLLLKYLADFDPEEPLFMGGHGDYRTIDNKQIYFHSGGAGIIMSHACQRKIQPLYSTAIELWNLVLDPDTQKEFYAASDLAIAYLVQREMGESVVVKAPPNLFFNCNFRGKHGDFQCCPVEYIQYKKIITCHRMTIQDFDEWNRILKFNHWFIKPPPTTVVTMLYNLRKIETESTEIRPIEFYLENGRATLSLKAPMVIFCDSTTMEPIKNIRNNAVDSQSFPTLYLMKELEEYDFFKQHYPMIVEHRAKRETYKKSRNTASYFLLTVFKFHCLQIAKQRNDFHTQHYAWIDIGGNHIMKNMSTEAPKVLETPNPRISVCYIHYRSSAELIRDRDDLLSGSCGMAATIMTADRDYIDRFYNACLSIFHEQLYYETGHAEEQILTYCYDRYPELFHLFYGDYYSLLSNYHEPICDIHCIYYYFIKKCMEADRFDLAKDASQKILEVLSRKPSLEKYETEIYNDLQQRFGVVM